MWFSLLVMFRSVIDFSYFTATRYCAGHQTNFGWDASGQSNLVELNAMLSRKFMIRRTKQQVLFELGEKTRETVLLDRSLIQFDGAMGDNMEAYATDMNRLNGRQREEVLLRYYQETALAKTKAVCAYLEGVVRNGADEKFIVFAHHRTLMDSIVELMTQLEVKFVRIDGRTQCDARTKFVDRFQNEGDCRVAVLSLKACNAGITLTAAQLVLFAELDWNPSVSMELKKSTCSLFQRFENRSADSRPSGKSRPSYWPNGNSSLSVSDCARYGGRFHLGQTQIEAGNTEQSRPLRG